MCHLECWKILKIFFAFNRFFWQVLCLNLLMKYCIRFVSLSRVFSMKLHLMTSNVYTMFSFVIVNLTNGYVKNLSPVKLFNNDRKQSYFHFHLQNWRWQNNGGFFFTRKTQVITENKNQDTGCELKKVLP